MDHARLAQIHREMARLHVELAEAYEQDAPINDNDRPSKPRAKKVRKPREIIRPAGEASSHIASKAARILSSRGFR